RTRKAIRPCIPDFIKAIKSNRPDIKICVLTANTVYNSHIIETLARSLGIEGEINYYEDIVAQLYDGYRASSWAGTYERGLMKLPPEVESKIIDNIGRFINYYKPTSLFDGSPVT